MGFISVDCATMEEIDALPFSARDVQMNQIELMNLPCTILHDPLVFAGKVCKRIEAPERDDDEKSV